MSTVDAVGKSDTEYIPLAGRTDNPVLLQTVFRINDIFGVDLDPDPRIHASDLWTIFVIDLQDANKKLFFVLDEWSPVWHLNA